jgi:hypothetical protein
MRDRAHEVHTQLPHLAIAKHGTEKREGLSHAFVRDDGGKTLPYEED